MVVLNTEESLYRFLQEHGDNGVKRGLLLFWSSHPNARFDSKVICYALDRDRLDTEKALRTMVEEGLLDRSTCNGVTLYSLTTNEDRYRPILELATLGWGRWQLMLKRIDEVANSQDRAGGN